MNNITKKIVIDSCVFLKILRTEHDSAQASALMESVINKEIKIIVPDLFIYEIYANCVIKNINYHDINFTIEKYKKSLLEIINLKNSLTNKAFEMANYGNPKSGFPSFCDCVYHALAIQEKCTFITADEKHFDKTHKKFGHIKLLKDA